MTWELRKIGSSGRLCLLLVLAVLCNGVLFALHAAGDADGYTVSALRQAMAQKDLPSYVTGLEDRLDRASASGAWTEYVALRRELSAADAAPGAGAAGGGISLLPGGLSGGIPAEAADGPV